MGLGGLIARNRKAPPPFTLLTAFAALLVAPALLVAAAAPSLLYGRAIHTIGWLWPATVLVYVGQSGYAAVRRLVTPAIGVPILAYNVVLALVALAQYAMFIGDVVPSSLLALSNAHVAAIGIALGGEALWSPLALAVPVLAPAYPARARLSGAVRITIAVVAAAFTLLILAVELPRSIRAQTSFAGLAGQPLQERANGDLAVGLRLFPVLRGVPSPPVQRHDLALVDSLRVGAVQLVLRPEIARASSLDSLARLVETLRGDSTLVLVSLDYGTEAGVRYHRERAAFTEARARDAHEIVRRLRPDIFIPVEQPYGAAERTFGWLTPQQWADYVLALARAAKSARPRTRIGLSASRYDAADSALFAWAARAGSPVDLPGVALYPDFDGAVGLRARMSAAERWMAAADPRKRVWVYAASGFPLRQGETSQRDAVWSALAWATTQPRVVGIVVRGAGDYETLTGIRTSTGRLRPVFGALRVALQQLAGSAE